MESTESNEAILSQHISSAGFIITRYSSSCHYFQMSKPTDVHIIKATVINTIVYADILTIDVSGGNADTKQLFILDKGEDNKHLLYVYNLSLNEPKYAPEAYRIFEIGVREDIQSVSLIS